jgi:hypothetical protein
LPAAELATRRARFAATVKRLAADDADDDALLQASVRRGLTALDEVVEPRRTNLANRAELATLQAAERHPDAGPGRLLELLQAERPALLEPLCRELVEQAEGAAVAAYRQAAGAVAERAAARAEQLQAEAASTFGVPLPPFVAPDLDLGVARVSFAYPRLTLLAEQLTSASWRLLGARAARARALAKARAQAAEEAAMVLGRLRGATSQQLGEAARRLGARLHRHQAALAAHRGGRARRRPAGRRRGAPPAAHRRTGPARRAPAGGGGLPAACSRRADRSAARLSPILPRRPGRPGRAILAVPALPLVAMGLATTADHG